MPDVLIAHESLVALLEPFAPDPEGKRRPALDGTDPVMRFAEDLVRVCRERGDVACGVAVLTLARAHASGQGGRALHLLLADPGMVALLEGGRR